jgi:DUF1680 family protein
VSFSLSASKPVETTLKFRIPAWSQGARIAVNGRALPAPRPGAFAEVRRLWHSGDRVELHLPQPMRLEPIDARHPRVAALVRGPQVLMAVKPQSGDPVPTLSRAALLAAARAGPREWRAGGVTLAPFTELGDRPYTTYIDVA